MKHFLFYISFGLTLSANCQTTKVDTLKIRTSYHHNKTIKAKLSYNLKGEKEGKSYYYNRAGNLDSTITFRNNKRNGLTQIFYDGLTRNCEYSNDSLLSEKTYDSDNNLMFLAPLTPEFIGEIQIEFLSGKTYFDHFQEDTFRIIGNIPIMNRIVSISGAMMTRVDSYSYAVRISKSNPDLHDIVITISAYGNLIESDKPVVTKIIKVPVK